MATGFLVNSTCYDNAVMAQDAYFSSQPVLSRFDTVAGYYITLSYQLINGVWMKISTASGPNWSNPYTAPVVAVPPLFPSCISNAEHFQNGLDFGWQLVAVIAIAWGVVAAARCFK